MSAWTLCIDFGTAYSKAAAAPAHAWTRFDPALVRPLVIGGVQETGNAFLLESAVFVDDDGVLFGRAAMARADAAGKKRMALRSFKTLLSVSDLDRALNTNAPASIDPHRVFQMRDLIVLYLAYLLAAVDAASAYDPLVAEATSIERRYAAPAWRSGDSAGMHQTVVRLFGEAEAFRQAVGDEAMLDPEGLSFDIISDRLPKAIAAPSRYEMGLIFEATAAAAYSSIGLADAGSHLIVVDMGAGTTDIAALARSGTGVTELADARVTMKQAGDFIDGVIANVVLEATSWAKTPTQKADLWRALFRQMRDIKEGVFEDGAATLRHDGKLIRLNMRDIERDRDFKDFIKNLSQAYEFGLKVVRDDAKARGVADVQAIAVGGGAAAPFVQDLLRKKPRGVNLRVTPRPATPDWAHAREFKGNLAPVFPQLAIAIGGALAPEAMLAARGDVTRAAGGRSGIPAGRD